MAAVTSGPFWWAFTPAFEAAWGRSQLKLPEGVVLADVKSGSAQDQLIQFRRLMQGGAAAVTLFDRGRLQPSVAWCYVADVISKSGENPLRGLGGLMTEPFVDVSHLYQLPAGATGQTVTALGSRLEQAADIVPACGDLHHLAILAHAEGLRVTGVVVASGDLAGFDPAALRPL